MLATGGAATLRHDNRQDFKRRGVVIYLQPDPHEKRGRIINGESLPLLQTDGFHPDMQSGIQLALRTVRRGRLISS